MPRLPASNQYIINALPMLKPCPPDDGPVPACSCSFCSAASAASTFFKASGDGRLDATWWDALQPNGLVNNIGVPGTAGFGVKRTVYNVCVDDCEALRSMPPAQFDMLRRGLTALIWFYGIPNIREVK